MGWEGTDVDGRIDVVDSYEKAIYWYTRASALGDDKAIGVLSHVKILKDC